MPTDRASQLRSRGPVLLDTHALLWWQAGSERLSTGAMAAIGGAEQVLVSPISCWEVAMLVAKGTIGLDRPVSTWVNDLLGESGPAVEAALSPIIAVRAGTIEGFHGDPADRLIYATAVLGPFPLVTKDRRLRQVAEAEGHVPVVW